MSMNYLEQRFPTFAEYIAQQRERPDLSAEDATPLYAHPVDEWILRTLNSTPAKALIEKAIDALVSYQFGQYLSQAVIIDQKSFPELYAILVHCSQTLGIPVPHTVDIPMGADYNAFTAGTDDYAFVGVAAGVMKNFSREEATFVIGHECGHIASRHMMYHTLALILQYAAMFRTFGLGYLGFIIRTTLGVALYAWERRAEVTCDRAGLLCCGDIKVAERALLRLMAGLADVDKIDIEEYLERSKEMQDYHAAHSWQQLYYSHPMIPKRIEGLRLFARSELYYQLTGKEPPAGEKLLTRAELDRLVNIMVKP